MRGAGRAASLLTMLLLAAGAAGQDVVERRGAEPPLVGASTIDDGGVALHTGSGADHFVPWDRVRRVHMDLPPPDLDGLMANATDLWRARTRVERGDAALAEPLFERLFERYRGRTHETARVVAEGLARCRLARGANALAVIPVLETTRLERAGVTTRSYAMLPPLLDAETSLCPTLAPAWIGARALEKLERDLADYGAGRDEVVSALADQYRRAARRQLGLGAEDDAPADVDHPGVALLARVNACEADDADARDAARRALADDLPSMPPWTEGWARFALGRSLVREPGVGRRHRGVVQLVHLPARFRAVLPHLSGLALAWAAEASRTVGDAGAAAVLEEELRRLFPHHPVRNAPRPVTIPRGTRTDIR